MHDFYALRCCQTIGRLDDVINKHAAGLPNEVLSERTRSESTVDKHYLWVDKIESGFGYQDRPSVQPKKLFLIQRTLRNWTQNLESLHLFGHFL